LISALVGSEWSASRPGRFAPREIASGTHWIGGWVGPRTDLDMEKKKILSLPGLELQPVASCYTDCAIPFYIWISKMAFTYDLLFSFFLVSVTSSSVSQTIFLYTLFSSAINLIPLIGRRGEEEGRENELDTPYLGCNILPKKLRKGPKVDHNTSSMKEERKEVCLLVSFPPVLSFLSCFFFGEYPHSVYSII
jgi:hypothetical protein